jgi:hypothetical protein|tara:strand:- start:13131 stop:13328 length:198 start_codon:yes stop_codon:yes gene_type:complete
MKEVERIDLEAKQIKDEVYRISWYMRGGVTANDLFWSYSAEDREILQNIIKDNIESTKKSGLPLV